MCGITGFLDPSGLTLDEMCGRARRMTEALAHAPAISNVAAKSAKDRARASRRTEPCEELSFVMLGYLDFHDQLGTSLGGIVHLL